MRILITGGAGFIGSNLTQRLVKDGHDVTVYDNLSIGKNQVPGSVLVQGDVLDRDKLNLVFKMGKFDVVYHLAALSRIEPTLDAPHIVHDHNVTGTINVLTASLQYDVPKVIYSSSSSVYGKKTKEDMPVPEYASVNPGSAYSASKLMAEGACYYYADLYGMNITMLRFCNVVGPQQPSQGPYATVVGKFLAAYATPKAAFTVYGDGSQARAWTMVDDVVEALVLSGNKNLKGLNVYNIGSGKKATSILDICKAIDPDRNIINQPERRGDYPLMELDITKAKKELGFEPKGDAMKWISEVAKAIRKAETDKAKVDKTKK